MAIIIILIVAIAAAAILFWQRCAIFGCAVNEKVILGTSATPSPQPQATLPESDNISPNQKPPEDKIIKFPIFNYHHLGPMPANADINRRAFTVTPEILEEHLKYFKENNYQIVPVSDLIKYFDTGEPLPEKAVALTFDDGYKEHYQNAFPILKKYQAVATFFVITDWVSSSTHPDNLNWGEIQEMSEAGMEFGSHSQTHPNLAALSDEVLKSEVGESKKILEEKLGKPCDLFSYPGGSFDDRIVGVVKTAGYKGAVGIYKIIEQVPKYRFSIRRFHADDNMESITEKIKDY